MEMGDLEQSFFSIGTAVFDIILVFRLFALANSEFWVSSSP